MTPPFFRSKCARCGHSIRVDASGNQIGLHSCVIPEDFYPKFVCECKDAYDGSKVNPVAEDEIGLIQTEHTDWRGRKFVTGHLDPSVNPEARGAGGQRLFPKPGTPHFRISWHPITQKPWYIPINQEAWRIFTMRLLTSEDYEYYRGGVIHRLKPLKP